MPNTHFADKKTGSEKKEIIKKLYQQVENYMESQLSPSVPFWWFCFNGTKQPSVEFPLNFSFLVTKALDLYIGKFRTRK